MKARKTWREKLDDDKGLPQTSKIEGRMTKRWGNGAINGLEYATRRHPFVSDAPLAPTFAGPPGARTFTFRYRAAARDLRYIVQRNTDLNNAGIWTEVYRYDSSTDQITELLPAAAVENAGTEIITLTDPAPGPQQFWRLRIEQVP